MYRERFLRTQKVTLQDTITWLKEKSDSVVMYIVSIKEQRIGTISFNTETREIGQVALLPEYHHQGIFGEMIEILKKIHNLPFFLHVKVDNEEAIHAYTKVGFVITKLWMELS